MEAMLLSLVLLEAMLLLLLVMLKICGGSFVLDGGVADFVLVVIKLSLKLTVMFGSCDYNIKDVDVANYFDVKNCWFLVFLEMLELVVMLQADVRKLLVVFGSSVAERK